MPAWAETGSCRVSRPASRANPREDGPIRYHLILALLVLTGSCPSAPGASPPATAPASQPAGPLRSDELLLICNADDPDSRTLASYYGRQRNVPRERIIGLKLGTPAEEMSAVDYDRLIRDPVRQYFAQYDAERKIRCLVTFWGVPIRIGARRPPPGSDKLVPALRKEFTQALDELERNVAVLEGVASATATAPLRARAPGEEEYQALLKRYAAARVKAWETLQRAATTGPADVEERKRFLAAFQAIEGAAPLILTLNAPAGNEAAQAQVAGMRKALHTEEQKAAEVLSRGLDDPQRDEARGVIRRTRGLLGFLQIIEGDLNRLRTEETTASVDSELSLVLWDEYPKYRWVLSALNWSVRTDAAARQQMPWLWAAPTLMVSRLDGPSTRVVRRLIDDAIAAENEGLSGMVCLDARGIGKDPAFGRYDNDLRELASMLWKNTDLTVRLDNKPDVYAAGSFTDVMFYCGWYSLRNYVPCCTFVRGAIGYHIASFEALSLKNTGEKGWVKGLLDAGVAATVGPVAEPYLHSFPLPREFFGLVLTGRFTLAECYAYTASLNSWMQMLIGDPLYNPFRNRPALKLEQVFTAERIPEEYRGGIEN